MYFLPLSQDSDRSKFNFTFLLISIFIAVQEIIVISKKKT